jgi:hypothetical protein
MFFASGELPANLSRKIQRFYIAGDSWVFPQKYHHNSNENNQF